MLCKICNKIDITNINNIIPSLRKLVKSTETCIHCHVFLSYAEMLMLDPYRFIIVDHVIYEIKKDIDISGSLVYIKFNDGKIIKEYKSRIIEHNDKHIPKHFYSILPDNAKFEYGNKLKRKLPSYIKIKKQ